MVEMTTVRPKRKKDVATVAAPPLSVAEPSEATAAKKAARKSAGKAAEKAALIHTESPALAVAMDVGIAGISAETKAAWIAEAAYFRAERRNFAPGFEMEDWYEAEREIEELLRR